MTFTLTVPEVDMLMTELITELIVVVAVAAETTADAAKTKVETKTVAIVSFKSLKCHTPSQLDNPKRFAVMQLPKTLFNCEYNYILAKAYHQPNFIRMGVLDYA